MNIKSIYLSKIWDELANDFDTYQPSIWQLASKQLINISNLSEGNRVLDIGCGKGNTLASISKIIGSTGKATGIDLSLPMVNFANQLINSLNITNVEILHQDASDVNINFKNNYFDNILGNFSLRYIIQTKQLLNAMIDKLKIGGTLSFTLWGRNLHDIEFDNIVCKYVELYKPLADKLSDTSTEYIKCENDVKKRLQSTKLSSMNIFTKDHNIIYESEDVFLEQLWNSLYREDLSQILLLGKNAFSNFYNEFLNHCKKYRVPNGISINWKVMYGVCKK